MWNKVLLIFTLPWSQLALMECESWSHRQLPAPPPSVHPPPRSQNEIPLGKPDRATPHLKSSRD